MLKYIWIAELLKTLYMYREYRHHVPVYLCFPGGSDGKESAWSVGNLGPISGLGRSSVGGHGNLLQHSCLENPIDRGAWWVTVHIITKSQTWLSNEACMYAHISVSVFVSWQHIDLRTKCESWWMNHHKQEDTAPTLKSLISVQVWYKLVIS